MAVWMVVAEVAVEDAAVNFAGFCSGRAFGVA